MPPGRFNDLPPEILHSIAEQAVNRDDDGFFGTGPQTILPLSSTCTSVRAACLPAILQAIDLHPYRGPFLVQWLRREPHIGAYIHCISFSRWKPTPRGSNGTIRVDQEWTRAAADALTSECRFVTAAKDDPEYNPRLKEDIAMSILGMLPNLRVIFGFNPSIIEGHLGSRAQVSGTVLKSLEIDGDEIQEEIGACRGLQLLSLFSELRNLKTFNTTHHCTDAEKCMWHTSRHAQWLTTIGSNLSGLRIIKMFESMPSDESFGSSFADAIPHLCHLRTLEIVMVKGDEQLDVLANAITRSEHLSHHLERLVLVVFEQCYFRWPGTSLVCHLAHFVKLRHLAVSFPGLVEPLDTSIKLPRSLCRLTFGGLIDDDLGGEWADWVASDGTRASFQPLQHLVAQIREQSLPDLTHVEFAADTGIRKSLEEWDPVLASSFLVCLIDLRDTCKSHNIQIIFTYEPEDPEESSPESIDSLISFMETDLLNEDNNNQFEDESESESEIEGEVSEIEGEVESDSD